MVLHNQESVGGGLGPPEKQGTIAEEGERKGSRTTTGTSFSMHTDSQAAGCLFHGLQEQVQTSAANSDSRGGHSLPALMVP